MRSVVKDLQAVPACLTSPQATADLQLIAQRSSAANIKDTIYKGSYKDADGKMQSTVRDALNEYYKDKCAYCEDFCKAEIEHYRPKKAVNDLPLHNGYFWLCYEWSNLLPSCRFCNTEGGKGNQFPIISVAHRVYLPVMANNLLSAAHCQANAHPLLTEQPYLLNPEIDQNFEQYFTFKINDDKTGIKMLGIDEALRGSHTVKICNLNRRVLQLRRLKIYRTYLSKINTVFEFAATGHLPPENFEKALFYIYKELEAEAHDIHEDFTLLKKITISSVENFTNLFAPYIENENQRALAVAVFANYKNAQE